MIAWIDAVYGDYSRSRFILRAVPSAVKDEEEKNTSHLITLILEDRSKDTYICRKNTAYVLCLSCPMEIPFEFSLVIGRLIVYMTLSS